MSGEIEALGAMTTASLAASAIEPEAGQRGEPLTTCANCSKQLAGRFCSNCGQSAHIHRTIGHLVEEFAHGLLHVDTKAWRTLPRLVFQPGLLTRDYVHGKRARYIAPLAMFLFSIFLMFFVFGSLSGPVDANAVFQMNETSGDTAGLKKRLAKARADLKTEEAKLAAAFADPDSPPGQEGRLTGAVAASQAKVEFLSNSLERAIKTTELPKDQQDASTWQDRVREIAKSKRLDINLGSAELEKRIRHTLENPDLALYKIEQKAYKLSFLLVPMSLPFLWLLFPFRRGVNMYDHTVFALYSLSFMSLLVVTFALASQGPGWLAQNTGWLLLAVPLHMFTQLKGAYSLGWKSAVWRTLWLMLFSGMTLTIYLVTILLLGLID